MWNEPGPFSNDQSASPIFACFGWAHLPTSPFFPQARLIGLFSLSMSLCHYFDFYGTCVCLPAPGPTPSLIPEGQAGKAFRVFSIKNFPCHHLGQWGSLPCLCLPCPGAAWLPCPRALGCIAAALPSLGEFSTAAEPNQSSHLGEVASCCLQCPPGFLPPLDQEDMQLRYWAAPWSSAVIS